MTKKTTSKITKKPAKVKESHRGKPAAKLGKDSVRNVKSCTAQEVAIALGSGISTVQKWPQNGCPRNVDKTFCLPDVYEWRIQTQRAKVEDSKHEQEVTKLKNQNQKLELEIEEKQRLAISRAKVEDIGKKQAAELRNYLTDTCMRNINLFVNKNLKQLVPLFKTFTKEAMRAFVAGGKAVDDL